RYCLGDIVASVSGRRHLPSGGENHDPHPRPPTPGSRLRAGDDGPCGGARPAVVARVVERRGWMTMPPRIKTFRPPTLAARSEAESERARFYSGTAWRRCR